MRVSTFIAKNSRGALMQVKDQLGEDAIILRNRRVGDRIEITATTDLNQPDWTPEPASVGGARRNDIRDQNLQNELTSLRDTLEQLLAKRSWQDSANVPATQATVGQRLAALGLSKSLGGWISDNVRDDGPLAPALRFDPWWQGKGCGEARFSDDGRVRFTWPADPESPSHAAPMDPFAAFGTVSYTHLTLPTN